MTSVIPKHKRSAVDYTTDLLFYEKAPCKIARRSLTYESYAGHGAKDIDLHLLHVFFHVQSFINVNIRVAAVMGTDDPIRLTCQKQFNCKIAHLGSGHGRWAYHLSGCGREQSPGDPDRLLL